MKTTGKSKRLYLLLLSMLLTLLLAAPFFASSAKVTVKRPVKGSMKFIYTDSIYTESSLIINPGVHDKDMSLDTTNKDVSIKVIATNIATPSNGYGWRISKGSATVKVTGNGDLDFTINKGDTATYVIEAVSAEVTVKAPKKGSITFLDSAHAQTFTLNAGDSDKTLNIATNSTVDLVMTAEGVSAGGDCYQWRWTANGAPDPASKEKAGKFIKELSQFDKSKWVFYAEDTHNPQLVAQVDATCEKDGTKEYYKCAVCSKMYSDSAATKEIAKPETIPAAHKMQAVAQVDAACEKAGTKAYYKCTVCSKLFSDNAGTKEITKAEEIPALGHDWDAGVVTTEATAAQTGVRTFTCKRDKTHTKTETIPKTGTSEEGTPGSAKTIGAEEGTPGSAKTIGADEVLLDEDAITPQDPEQTKAVTDILLKGSVAWKNDLPGASFSLLQAKGAAKSSGTIKLTWKKVAGAKKYLVYGKPYGKKDKFKKLYEGTAQKYIHRSLKNKKYQKYIVLAVNGKKTLTVSKAVFVAPKGTSRGNVSKVTVTPKKLSLQKGKKKTLKATYTKKRSLKTYRKICFESGNINVATVTSKGKVKITGKTGDSTWIYAYAQNGVFAKIKVTVK